MQTAVAVGARRLVISLFIPCLFISFCGDAFARNKKLITLPVGERVEIQLDNPVPRSSKKSGSCPW